MPSRLAADIKLANRLIAVGKIYKIKKKSNQSLILLCFSFRTTFIFPSAIRNSLVVNCFDRKQP